MRNVTNQTSSAPQTNSGVGPGCLIVFGLPFFLAGAFAVQQSIFGRVREGDRIGLAAFGTVFALVGVGIMSGGVFARRALRRRREILAAHPGKPWLVNRAWAGGTINDDSAWAIVVLWFFTLVWNGISFAATFSALRDIHRDKSVLFVLLFPAVGAVLLAVAIYQTVRRLKFGRSVFEMETIPGCVGGWLAGTIQTRVAIAAGDLHVTLRCVHRVTTGSGKNSSTREDTIWESEQLLTTARLPQGSRGGSCIPVAFKIPRDCRITDDANSRDQIIWRLRAHAAVPGADYLASFIVPVFDAAATTQQTTPNFVPAAERAAAPLRGDPPQKSGRAEDPRIKFLRGPGNRKRFVFPAGRKVGSAITVTLVALLFAGGGMIVHNAGGPVFVVAVGEVVGALIAWGALILWFRETEVSADPHSVERTTRMLGQGGTRTVPAADVASVAYRCTTEINNTPYFTIALKLKQGDDVKLVSGVRQRDAEWIAGEIAQTIGVEGSRDTSGIEERRRARSGGGGDASDMT